jgi:hypothetical protein
MEEKNIFSLEDLSDLDDEVRSQLQAKTSNDDRILRLFKLKDPLSIDEIIVGLARQFGIKKKRTYVINRLYGLAQSNYVKKVEGKKGIYKLCQ